MQRSVDRQFYSIDVNDANKSHFRTPSEEEKEKLINNVANSVIGKDKVFSGPYGQRLVVYLDYIASGRALSFIEDYIQDEVLPEYGNTHTTTSVTSLQTTLFRHEARDIIRNAVNASEHDSVIFTGSGTTGAIHKLIHALNLKEAPVVFVGPYEHHSNLLPWKEKGAKVISIQHTEQGLVDLSHLEQELQAWSDCGRQLIGSFSAASNVTGILCDVDAVSVLLHKYGALAFWDYATAAPYVRLDMNPVVAGKDRALVYKDAMFMSPHKFVGGVNTPGVLVVKKKLFQNDVPEECGGGTVFFVRREAHRYLREPELREEGGTPNIVGAIRAGLVFQLKSSITPELIMEKEQRLFRQAVSAWKSVPNLVILGDLETERLPIFSFLLYNPSSGLFLHHNYTSALLNDLFGIQARGGCACAGPYAMELLGLSEEKATVIEELLAEDKRLDRVHLRRYMEYSHREILRPGFTRLNLPYFISEDQLDFVLQAVTLVAEHGWKLLPQYIFNPETGEWRHKDQQVFKERKWLGHISYASGHMEYSIPKINPKGPLPQSFQDCLSAAKQLFQKAEKSRARLADQTLMFDEEARPYRWFLLPSEASQILSHNHARPSRTLSSLPFCPPSLMLRLSSSQDAAQSFASCHEHNSQCSLNTTQEAHILSKEEIDSLVTGISVLGTTDGNNSQSEPVNTVENENADSFVQEPENFPQMLQQVMEKGYCDRKPTVHGFDSVECEIRTIVPKVSSESGVESHRDSRTNSKHVLNTNETELSGASCGLQRPVENMNGGEMSLSLNGSAECSETLTAATKEDPVSPTVSVDSCEKNTSTSKSKSRQKKKVKENKEGTLDVQNGGSNVQKQKAQSWKEKTALGNHWCPPNKDIFKPTLKALEEFSMIRDGDRVLVCLSGGKDSLSLLHTMHQYQFYCRSKGISFKLGAVTVDPQTPSYDPSPLKKVMSDLGVPYFFESQCIMETAMNLPYECASICSFCSRMKRGRIYAAARREGYNVLALGQHLDDLAESFIMSLFHNGCLRTMKAHYTVQEGDLRVIRPFVYVREKDLRSFAEKNCLPVIAENCPACFEAPKERHRTKQLLASQEVLFPNLYSSILSSIKPVMSVSRTNCKAASLLPAADPTDDDLDI